jgi:hypothetical protein
MSRMPRCFASLVPALLGAVLLAGCATTFDIGGADITITPQQAAAAPVTRTSSGVA